jgi:hypothetical protein
MQGKLQRGSSTNTQLFKCDATLKVVHGGMLTLHTHSDTCIKKLDGKPGVNTTTPHLVPPRKPCARRRHDN